MLFDLQGKRRRVVQVTFTSLAVLMGGGLVLFGVGSDVSGGLANVFDGGGGGNSGNSQVEKRIETLEKRAKADPRATSVRADLTRSYFQLASSEADANGTFGADAKADLRKSAANWQAYRKLAGDKADAGLAATALQLYGPGALNDTGEAKATAQLIASQRNTPNAYLQLVQYATLDSDTRTSDLAGQKAVDLAEPGQRKQVRANLKQIKQQTQAAQAQAAQQSQGGTPQQ